MVFNKEALEAIKQKDLETDVKEHTESDMEEEKKSEDEEEVEASKRSGKNGEGGFEKLTIGVVTPIERPSRERKTVERYAELAARDSASKQLSIEEGPGTQLKDIPNVAYKLSKRKPDANLKTLHSILFRKRGQAKANLLKKNIGLFSGYVWAEDKQEKQRAEVKEKLDKCNKEKLFDFCDILNIQINKSSLKKEELSSKILEFLVFPHATTKVLLSDKEQKLKKRKAKARRSKTSSKKESGKKRKCSSNSTTDGEDKVNEFEASESNDDEKDSPMKADSDDENNKSEKEESHPKKQLKKGKSSSKKGGQKDSRGKIKESFKGVKKDSSLKPAKSSSNSKEVMGTSKEENKKKTEPTNEEIHAVVAKILKEVDFNTATLSDILKRLATQFEMDLMHRKKEVKAIITDVVNNMSDDEDKKEEESAADGDGHEDADHNDS